MSPSDVGFSVKVDVTNPGQFFACCGLLELAGRIWPDSEGGFEDGAFHVRSDGTLDELLRSLSGVESTSGMASCFIEGLSEQERSERASLEDEGRRLKKEGKKLSEDKEARRKELGALARVGPVSLGPPFSILLDWWQTGDEDLTSPKTWAGRQEIHRIARAAQDSLRDINNPDIIFDFGAVLHEPEEYRKSAADARKAVEPFYFDARRFAHALDVGFSLDVQDAETVAHPAVELLCLIGIQRFRPAPSEKGAFDYWTWPTPLPPSIAAAVAGGSAWTPGRIRYRFRFRFRDDQHRYKAFDFAVPLNEE